MELSGRRCGFVEDLNVNGANVIKQKIRGSASSGPEDNPQRIKSHLELTIAR
jgi:hypothetical protein